MILLQLPQQNYLPNYIGPGLLKWLSIPEYTECQPARQGSRSPGGLLPPPLPSPWQLSRKQITGHSLASASGVWYLLLDVPPFPVQTDTRLVLQTH